MATISAILAWALAHKAQLVAIAAGVYGLASLVVGLLPESASKRKAVRVLEWASFLAHADSPRMFKLPGRSNLSAALRALLAAPPDAPASRGGGK